MRGKRNKIWTKRAGRALQKRRTQSGHIYTYSCYNDMNYGQHWHNIMFIMYISDEWRFEYVGNMCGHIAWSSHLT